MSDDPLVLLDQLDDAHVAWLAGSEGWSDRAIEAMEELPKLTDALRRVLAGCDHLDRMRDVLSSAEARMSYADATKHIRACIAAALTPEPVQP